MQNRREILKAALIAAAAAGLPLPAESRAKPAPALDILVLGGTGFIGPHMVREALRRGHSVTLFNRGRTNSGLFPDLETIRGDRGSDLTGLAGRRFDAVIDNSGYMPQHVTASAELLAPSAGHYLFVSSISVYASFAAPNDETSEVAWIDPLPETFSWDNYGALKAVAERRVADAFGNGRWTVLRPTYICGPGDHTDRFTYWPVRVTKGGPMIWPGSQSHPLQIIDVRDLAIFTIGCLERRVAGTYNTVTPAGSYTFGRLLDDSRAVTGADVEPVWVDDAFIREQDIGRLLPIWHPLSGDVAHASAISGVRARAAGLDNRPVRETIRDLLDWWRTLAQERIDAARFPMTPDREQELLEVFRST